MEATLSEREWVIGLYDYRPVPDPARAFMQFNEIVTDELSTLGVALTYVGIEGEGYTGKAQKAHGAAHKRLLDSEFSGITVLNLVCNPKNSSQPAYDRFISASLSITPHNDNLLAFSMNEAIVTFGSEHFLRILQRLENIHDWSAGYAFVDLVSRQPEFHVMGLDDGNLSPEELERLTKWYCASPGDKMSRIRSVYPFNLLNEDQLAQKIENGHTLREFAQKWEGSTLTGEGFRRLMLWKVPEKHVPKIRSILDGSYVVIA